MKTWLTSLILIALSSLFACEKDNVELIDTIISTKNGWTRIDLNADFTIQFPGSQYEGAGYKLRTSPSDLGDKTTFINRKDELASLSATFCNPNAYPCNLLQYNYDSLSLPLPSSIPFRNYKGEDDHLTNRITFGTQNSLLAVLYFGENAGVTFRPYEGRLYTVSRPSGLLRGAGSVQFTEETKAEIIDILSTITPK